MRNDKQRRKDMIEVAKRIHLRGWISALDMVNATEAEDEGAI